MNTDNMPTYDPTKDILVVNATIEIKDKSFHIIGKMINHDYLEEEKLTKELSDKYIIHDDEIHTSIFGGKKITGYIARKKTSDFNVEYHCNFMVLR